MSIIDLATYLDSIKAERNVYFAQPYDLVYACFEKLGFTNKEPLFFIENASYIVDNLRAECWKEFLLSEEKFTSNMLKKLINPDIVKDMTPVEAITWFAETYPTHLYQLNLSNTQSRRSRAGKEFECIIELLLIGSEIPMDSQGNIGKQSFVNKGLGKLVDAVSPGVIEYIENKRNTVLISAKTTLRERWQEVPEEMGRTGASEMFLATLDENVTQEVLDTLYEANIQLTTTKSIKEKCYKNNNRVLTFEDLLSICIDNNNRWNRFIYSTDQLENIIDSLDKQKRKHENHPFVKEAFDKRMKAYYEKLQTINNN